MPLAVDDFLNQSQTLPVLDVRSPGEFAHAHLPGAVNMPLFDNAERAEIGTIYKQVGRDAAVLRGLELVGPKMADFVRQAQALNPDGREVLVHCWRGGMRSGSMAWLLNTAGIRAQTLEGGYKAYRNTVLTGLAQPKQVLVLGGKTGSGKTDVLKQLAALGEQVIDLEALAHHKGSSYGAIGQLPQPSTEHYENRVFEHYRHLDPTKRVWVEDESRSVGRCFVPVGLWQQMQTAPVAFIDVPRAVRVERLVREYTGIDHALLVEATERIRKRLGGQAYKDAIDALNRGDYASVADLTLNYYDKAYLHSLNQREKDSVSPMPIAIDDPARTAQQLIAWADANVPNGVFP